MDSLLRSGIPFEIAGLAYFVFYLLMQSRRNAARFSGRTKILTLVAAIALVAAVPLGYGDKPLAIVGMLGLAALALISTVLDRRAAP
ncbi:MAG TPA: hypothetical protein VGN14_03705 [Candidatus Elarobacter sp.]